VPRKIRPCSRPRMMACSRHAITAPLRRSGPPCPRTVPVFRIMSAHVMAQVWPNLQSLWRCREGLLRLVRVARGATPSPLSSAGLRTVRPPAVFPSPGEERLQIRIFGHRRCSSGPADSWRSDDPSTNPEHLCSAGDILRSHQLHRYSAVPTP
jgi:hypothetical protein